MTDAVAEHKEKVIRVFDTVASVYDNPALRFFPFCADAMVAQLKPRRGAEVLDVATGTGALAAALAQAVGPEGRVTGIDLSENMLARAEHNIKKMALNNVDLFQMDGEEPDLRRGYFDAVTCSFGLFFMPRMGHALSQWRLLAKPGAQVLFSSFTDTAFRPLTDHLFEGLQAAGVDVAARPLASERLKDAEICRTLMEEAGYHEVSQKEVQLGYHLQGAHEWWEVVWNSAMRGLVQQLPSEQQQEFQREHLETVSQYVGDDGLWLDVQVRFTQGRVPDDNQC
jgi:ubiquinone/menaquinone biosynthesis C-methylase UbiE